MRILKGLLIGVAIFIGLLFLDLFYSISLAVSQGQIEHSHATGLSAVFASLLEATILNPYFYAAFVASLIAGYILAKPRNDAKPAS